MSSSPLRFPGKVVVVTGAGGGLGKTYALLFAERGAAVVVNDLGGSPHGEGHSARPADAVVNEIRKKGGKAIANYDSVEEGQKIVEAAIKTYGRIDVLINNAGILRDKSIVNTSNDDWDIVHRVHLRGSFIVSRAAWPYMKKQQYGKIIMTASNAGVYGNFGQSNYSSAKLGLLGLSNTLSIEGQKYGIQCNTIIPTAGSRLTQTVMPPDLIEALKPEFVTPLVLWLCHADCSASGGLYEAAAGWVGQLKWQRSVGAVVKRKGKEMTPEDVRDNWEDITNMDNATQPNSLQEVTGQLMGVLDELKGSDSGSQTGEGTNVIGVKKPGGTFTYTDKEVILYALSVGVSTLQTGALKFLYEGDDDFSVLPTFGVIPAFSGMQDVLSQGAIPNVKLDLSRVLHGEQFLKIYKPFPSAATLKNIVTVVDVLDKGSGAVIIIDVETYDVKTNDKICFNQFVTFLVGSGGFGGKRSSDKLIAVKPVPEREPDRVVTERTGVDQAALYRLNVDRNPLHLDPNFAALAGFQRPILHGLCTLGYACRHILSTYCHDDISRFKSVKNRFTKPVIPGERISTSMWLSSDASIVHFKCVSVESGNEVLSGGFAEIEPAITQKIAPSPSLSSNNLKSAVIFDEMKERLKSRPDVISSIKAIFQYNITRQGEPTTSWTLDLKTPPGSVCLGVSKEKPDCTITVSDDDFMSLVSGKVKGPQLFMSGKLKISGNIMLSQKLQTLLEKTSKL